MKRNYIYVTMFAGAMMLAGCSGGGDDAGVVTTPPDTPAASDGEVAIGFATNMESDFWEEPTRATTGVISDLKTVSEGFGVIAYLTDDKKWATAIDGKTATTYPVPDFMYDQPVVWNATLNRWGYSPMKYWPNPTNNSADRYVSFFAYAPFVDRSSMGTTGITDMTKESDHRPFVVYTIDEGGSSIDLLWASNADRIDCKRNGNGLIYYESTTEKWQAVPLQFKHALSCVDVYVQRVYDEPTFSGKTPGATKTAKVFMRELKLASSSNTATNGLFKRGRLDLETGTWDSDGTWSASPSDITYPATAFDDKLAGASVDDAEEIRNAELEKWAVTGTGVDDRERLLFKAGSIMLIPQTAEITITPTISYSMVTRASSEDLVYSPLTDAAGNHYSRIGNTVTGNDLKIKLEAAKRYKLVIRIGVEHVDFIVDSIEDWDFPMRLDTSVTPGGEETIDHKLDED